MISPIAHVYASKLEKYYNRESVIAGHSQVLKMRHQEEETMTKYFAKVKNKNSSNIYVEMNYDQYMVAAPNKVIVYVDDATQEYAVARMAGEDSYTDTRAPRNAIHTAVHVFNDRKIEERKANNLPRRVTALEAEVATLKRQKRDLEQRYGCVSFNPPRFF
jgi:hypothetical protein